MTLLLNVPKRPKRLPQRRKRRKAPLNPTVTARDFSSEDGSSDVSDLDKFEEAYKEFGGLTAGVDDVDFDRIVAGNTNDGGLDTLQTLANVPKTWPLARLTVPLSGFSKQLERLLEGYCMEVMATNAQPTPSVHQDVCQRPGLAACIPLG